MIITVTNCFATEALAWNRTRTVSLGIGQIMPADTAGQATRDTWSDRDCPLVALANCTLIARRLILLGAARCRGWPASGPGRLRPDPYLLTGVFAEVSGIKRDFTCTLTGAFPPVFVVLRARSRLMLEGRTRTLSGPSPDLGPAWFVSQLAGREATGPHGLHIRAVS
jgi:hypothetical protein